jgi:hypothetical protein
MDGRCRPDRRRQCLRQRKLREGLKVQPLPSFFGGGDAGGEPENLQAAIVEACLQNGLWRSLIVECDFGMAVRNCALPGSTDMFMLRWKDMEVRMAMCYNHAVNERSKKTNRYFSI